MTSRFVVLAVAVVLVASSCGGSKTTTQTVVKTTTVVRTVTTAPPAQSAAPCTGSDLSVTFKVQPGSAGAGNIVYTLALANTSSSTCTFAGWPKLVFLAKDSSVLPTDVVPEPGSSAIDRQLVTGGSISYDARFSPDVPGTGDQQTGACQRTATAVRLAPPGGGTVDGPVSPPTSICEQGRITLRPAA